jgi:phosphatidate cytidylyltransferase
MLLTRVLTAAAILPVVLGMLFFAPPAWWALFMLVISLLACWEWSRMCGLTPAGQGSTSPPRARSEPSSG